MNIIYDRSTVEPLKLRLQRDIYNLLLKRTLNADDSKIVLRAMEYMVTTHGSYQEQYYRLHEYILILIALRSRYECSNTLTSL